MPTRFRIRQGLDIPISGAPEQIICEGPPINSVALLGRDHPGQRASMLVEEGDYVRIGQPLFADRKHPKVLFTSPGTGVVRRINRGERRTLRSVIVELQGNDEEEFPACSPNELANLSRERVSETLRLAGLWTAFRTRPFGMVPDPERQPRSIFVTAMDSNPLAANPEVVIEEHRDDFVDGLAIISRLTDGPVFVCKAAGSDIPVGDEERITSVEFTGPHPAGSPGTHIHFLDPVGPNKTVWHVNHQDVVAIGRLFSTGRLWTERVISLSGPRLRRPRLVRTRLGANVDDLTRGELKDGECRVISGSILSGHHASEWLGFLGRYHGQVTVVGEGHADRKTIWKHWRRGYSASDRLASLFFRGRETALTTASHGRPTIVMPIDAYERVIPLDVLPVPLLRALLVGDADMARALGCLELDEEDLALCSFVCPGKIDYGPYLRAILTRIEKEG